MPRKKLDVALVDVRRSPDGYRYTCRNPENRVIYDSPRAFRSARHASEEIKRRWPNARIEYQ